MTNVSGTALISDAGASVSVFSEPAKPNEALKYRAFICYSRRDLRWARWLQNRLEAFKIPLEIIGRDTERGAVPDSLRPVFRDKVKYAAGDRPSAESMAALDESAALIVLCSPDSATSDSVSNQIKLFKSRHPDRPVTPLLVRVGDAGVDLSFPLALRYKIAPTGDLTARSMKVLAADLREQADGPDFAVAKIVAGIIGVSQEEVFQRTQRSQQRRKKRWLFGLGAAAIALLALTLFAESNRRSAQRQRDIAEARELAALADVAARSNAECALALSSAAVFRSSALEDAAQRPFKDALRKHLSGSKIYAAIASGKTGTLAIARSIAWRPGSRDIVFVGEHNRLNLWNAETRRTDIFGSIAGGSGAQKDPIHGLSWTPAGDALAILRENSLELWDAGGQRRISAFEIPNIVRVAWRPDGKSALITVLDFGVFVLDVNARQLAAVAPPMPSAVGAAWSPDGARVAVVINDNEFMVQNTPGDRVAISAALANEIAVPRSGDIFSHSSSIASIAWSPDGDHILAGLTNGQIWIWNTKTQHRSAILSAHDAAITALAFEDSGKALASADERGRVLIWLPNDWSLNTVLAGHSSAIAALQWDQQGAYILARAEDGATKVWSPFKSPGAFEWVRRDGWVWDVAWPGETDRIAAVMDQVVVTAETPAETPRRIAYSTQILGGAAAVDAPLYAFFDARELVIKDVAENRLAFQEQFPGEIGRPLTVALAPDGSKVAIGALNGTIIWSVADRQPVPATNTPSHALAISPDSRHLAIASLSNATISIVDTSTGALVQEFSGAPEQVRFNAVAFSRRGERVAAAGEDGAIYVWRNDASDTPVRWRGTTSAIEDMSWSRGDAKLATVSRDGKLYIRHGDNGDILTVINAHKGGARTLAWSADEMAIATGGEDGTVRVFDTRFDTITAIAKMQREIGLSGQELDTCLRDSVMASELN